MDSTFHIVTVMPLDTAKIRHEIRNVLKDGSTRSTKIVEKVKKKVGSEKTIYRQIKEMSKSGQIKSNVYSRAHIEYELVKVTESVKNSLQNLTDILKHTNDRLDLFHNKMENKKTRPLYIEQLFTLVTSIKQIQTIESRLRIFSMLPAFKKSSSFIGLEKQIEDTWKIIISLVDYKQEEKLFNELLMNFIPFDIQEAKVINK